MKKSEINEQEHVPDFWERIFGKFSELVISCIEPVLKTVSTFGIITAATFGLIFADDIRYLPISIVVGSTLAIIFLWRSGNRTLFTKSQRDIVRLKAEIEGLREELASYDKRIGNIEFLDSFEEKLARREVENREKTSMGASKESSDLQSAIPRNVFE
jgi:hypothetical protein